MRQTAAASLFLTIKDEAENGSEVIEHDNEIL
jgi:hypothetical protein